MNPDITLQEILAVLAKIKPRRIETDLQDAIAAKLAAKLAAHSIEFAREVKLDKKNRLDFMLRHAGESICLETKVRGASGPDTERQLLRYALTGKIDRIVLVTTTSFNCGGEGFIVGEKLVPIHIVNLEMNFL